MSPNLQVTMLYFVGAEKSLGETALGRLEEPVLLEFNFFTYIIMKTLYHSTSILIGYE